MPNAISYIRFSSGPQGKGSTTERQEKLIERWFAEHPEVHQSLLSQQDLGVSAFKGDHLNHGLGRILGAIDAGEIKAGDFILVENIDRIGRLEPFQMVELIQRIVSKDVTIVTLEDGYVYSRDALNNDMSSLYILIGKIQQAHQYSQTLSRRIRAAYERKAIKARKGERVKLLTPFWLNKDGAIDARKGEIVRACVDLYMKGHGHRQIILSLRGQYPEVAGMHPRTLQRWLTHRALIGEWNNAGDPIPNVFEPLLDPRTFYLLQKEQARRTKIMSPEETYDLSGIVVCKNCGGRFYYRRKAHKGYTIIYANCSTYLKRGKPYCDNNKTWAYEVLRSILQFTMGLNFQAISFDRATAEIVQEIEALKQRRSEVNDSINRLLDVLEKIPDQQNTIDRLKILEDTKQSIESDIFSLEGKIRSTEITEEVAMENYDRAAELGDELADDPIALRETLKRSGYQIRLNSNHAEIPFSGEEDIRFELLGRSTRFKCYFVRADIKDESSGLEDEFFYAVDRRGVIDVKFTKEDLMQALQNSDFKKSYSIKFSDGLVQEEIVFHAEA